MIIRIFVPSIPPQFLLRNIRPLIWVDPLEPPLSPPSSRNPPVVHRTRGLIWNSCQTKPLHSVAISDITLKDLASTVSIAGRDFIGRALGFIAGPPGDPGRPVTT